MVMQNVCAVCGAVQYKTKINYADHTLYQCLRCGVICSDFLLDKKEAGAYYAESDYRYLLKYRAQVEYRGRKILKRLGKYVSGGTVLDVGAGCGFFLNLARKQGWDVLGIDISPGACEYARNNFGLEMRNCNIGDANLPDASLDVITLQHVFEHLPEPRGALADLKRILKDTGILVIVVPNTKSIMSYCAHGHWLCLAEKAHLFHYDKKSLTMLLEKAGFKILDAYAFQWNGMDILWAIKTAMLGRSINFSCPARQDSVSATSPYMTNDSGIRVVMQKILYPVNAILGKFGLGAELILMARKG